MSKQVSLKEKKNIEHSCSLSLYFSFFGIDISHEEKNTNNIKM